VCSPLGLFRVRLLGGCGGRVKRLRRRKLAGRDGHEHGQALVWGDIVERARKAAEKDMKEVNEGDGMVWVGGKSVMSQLLV